LHPSVYKTIEKILLDNQASTKGGRLLEIGSLPSDMSLLASPILKLAKEKIGINIDGPYQYKDFKILKGNANKMDYFESESFDCIICNAMLEHDKYFWKTVSEVYRLIKKGGLVIFGTPGYTETRIEKIFRKIFSKKVFSKSIVLEDLQYLSFCFRIHNYPGDYYRFSEQTFKEVFFEGYEEINIQSIMLPPRIIGYGYKA